MRFWTLLLVFGCEQEVPHEIEAATDSDFVIPTCDKYEDQPGIRGFCLTIWAPTLDTQEEMEASCRQAGIWEGECRAAWLMVGMDSDWGRSRSIDDLLDLCNDDARCAVAVLKMRSEHSLERQMEHCVERTGEYAGACVAHSIHRWWRGSTDPNPIDTLSNLESGTPEEIGWWIAAIGLCAAEAHPHPCLGSQGAVHRHCIDISTEYSDDPSICDAMEESPEAMTELDLQGQPTRATPTTMGLGTESRADDPTTIGIGVPDPRTHGHVPGGVPGGGHHRPPEP